MAPECMTESMIVAFTGHARATDRRRCAVAGFDLHLPKPLSFTVLEHLSLFLRTPDGSQEKYLPMAQPECDALLSLIGAAMQMTDVFLDVAASTSDLEVRERALTKAARTGATLAEMVQKIRAADRTDLLQRVDELRLRYERLRL